RDLHSFPTRRSSDLMHQIKDPEDARKTVEYWADQSVDNYKAYMHITRDELGAAIQAAHKRGLKVTGHLCSVTFRDAAALGIDDLDRKSTRLNSSHRT